MRDAHHSELPRLLNPLSFSLWLSQIHHGSEDGGQRRAPVRQLGRLLRFAQNTVYFARF
jgi:hypothetical protein